MALGEFLGGYAQARNARERNKEEGERNSLIGKLLNRDNVKTAAGVGGTPVSPSGVDLKKVIPGGEDAKPEAAGGKIKSVGKAIGKGALKLLGFSKGGRITKSGVAFVHKGEEILPAKKSSERKPLRMSARKSGRR